MNTVEFSGMTDSPAGILSEPRKCTNCDATSRVADALCLKCLLEGALLDDESHSSSGNTLTDILAEVKVGGAKWRIGNYEILDEIGRGGMGVIYRARETHSHRIVALKRVLAYHADSDHTLARFRREAETGTRLDHPNIVPIYCVGEDEEGLPFFAMKFASGGNLAQARDAFRREPRKSVLLMTKVASAVQYAHEQGVLHRDLKPSNILLDNQWEPMVSDFGLAKWIEESNDLTRTLTVFGTPGYIAPEQAARPDLRLTSAADVYNLGAILFELLTGRSPFLGEHALAVLQQALEKPAPRLRSFAPQLDRDLETICGRCLEREASARYHSAGSVGQDLQNWLEGRPIKARPVNIAMRMWRWSRRNRVLATTLGAVLLLCTAFAPWVMHSWKLEKAADERAMAARSIAVLPFFDLDKVAIDESLAALVADSLKRELERTAPAMIKPLPPESTGGASVEQVRKIGQAARTRAVLTGTTRMVSGRKRVSVRLTDAATGEPILVRVCEGSGLDQLKKAIGKEMGAPIDSILNNKDWSELLQSRIDPGLRDHAAREAIVAGRQLVFRYNESDLDKGIELLKKAALLQPESALAHSNLAMAVSVRTHFISDPHLLQVGEAEALEAVRLSPNSSNARLALAGVLYQQGKFAEGVEEALRAVESVGPDEGTARFLGMASDTLGRPDTALRWHSLAGELGNRSSDEYGLMGDCSVKLGDDNKAVEYYNRALELQPDYSQARIGLCHLALLQGDFERARELCQRDGSNQRGLGEVEQIAAQIELFARKFDTAEKLYADILRKDSSGGGSFYGAVSYESALGRVKQALGDEIGANTLLRHCFDTETAAVRRTPANPEALYRLAAVESSLGMSRDAVIHWRQAVTSGWTDYRSFARDPRFDTIREDPQAQITFNNLTFKVADMRRKMGSSNPNSRTNND
jgi:tetratricopeptide (TPR) repeat protein/tRNA A-37 threonylcarbamoyl transferase component Bud32/TolB-like protein